MALDKDTSSLIISIISLVLAVASSVWTIYWSVSVRISDKSQAQQLKLSELSNKYVKDGIQVHAPQPCCKFRSNYCTPCLPASDRRCDWIGRRL